MTMGYEVGEDAAPDALLRILLLDGRIVDIDLISTVFAAALRGKLPYADWDEFFVDLERATQNGTPASTWYWGRVTVELVEVAMEDDEERIADYAEMSLHAIQQCASSVTHHSAHAEAMLDWVCSEAIRIVRLIGSFAATHEGMSDDWMGIPIAICDYLVAWERFTETTALLSAVIEAGALCGPNSRKMQKPGTKSQFRDDAVYLLDLVRGRH